MVTNGSLSAWLLGSGGCPFVLGRHAITQSVTHRSGTSVFRRLLYQMSTWL